MAKHSAPKLRMAKGMLLPILYTNNASIGAEWQRGARTSWTALAAATFGFHMVSVGTFGRLEGRFGHRWYVVKLDKMGRGLHPNPYVEVGTGLSNHRDWDTDDESGLSAYRSVFSSVAIGQQLFARSITVDAGLGLRGHVGTSNHGQGNQLLTGWKNDAWLSVLVHFQVGFGMGRGEARKRKKCSDLL